MVSKWVKVFLKIDVKLSNIQMDAVVLVPSTFAELRPPLSVPGMCLLV